MAKKRTLKLLSIVCAAAFFTSACGSGGGDASSDPSGSQQESKTEGTASGQSDEKPSEESSESAANDQAADNGGLITLTTVVSLSDAMQQYIGVKDDVQTNNSWYNGYEKDLGIHVENLWSVPGSQYQDKLNAQISAGDIPDVFNVNSSQLKTLVDNGMVMELTDLFEQNASDFTREMMEADDYTALEQCKMNGGLYALPSVSGNHDNVPIMWIRRDWMEKLGKEAPTTLAELEALAQAGVVVFDKTGTLTQGKFSVAAVHPDGMSQEELLELAALAEQFSTHPISKSIVAAWGGTPDQSRAADVEEIAGHGVRAVIDGRTVLAGNGKLMAREGIPVPSDHDHPGTIIHVAAEGRYAGHLVIADQPKETSAQALRELKAAGVRQTVMLTGDAQGAAQAVAQELGLDRFYAQLLPADKVERVENLLQEKGPKETLVFVGDGINDAPVLSRADIGVAMGALGSDAAIEAADIVLMDDDLLKLTAAVRIARKTLSIVRQNVVFALGVKLLVLILSAVGLANMWAAVFADVGVSVLAILNASRMLKAK